MPEVTERLASIEATLGSMEKTLAKQDGWLERSAHERTQHHTETVKQLAEIGADMRNVKSDVKAYQEDCTKERLALGSKIQENNKKIQEHDRELAKIEAVSAWKATFISTVIAIAGVCGAWAVLYHPDKTPQQQTISGR